MRELKQIYEYERYSSKELRQHKQELQEEINAINGELNLRRGNLMELMCNQLHDIFEKAKENGIAIDIEGQETYLSFNPADEEVPAIHLT